MPFVIYADFEATTEKIQTCTPEKNQSYTEAYQNTQIVDVVRQLFVVMMMHSASSHRYADEKFLLQIYRKNVRRSWTLQKGSQEAFKKPLKMSEEGEKHFRQAEECHVCKSYTEKDIGARDHCHITGKYRGSVHIKIVMLIISD